MAETLANELLKVLVKKMTDEAFKRVARAHGIYNELKELKKTLSRIQDLLQDASQKEVTHKSVKEWLNALQHLAYDIDDVLDDVATEAMHRELTLQEPAASTSMVRKLIPSCCTNFSLTHRLSPKLDSINRELENLEKRKTDLGLLKIDEKPRNTSRRSETSLPERDVVGREVEKEQLLRKLLGDDGSSQDNFSVLPIVGMGGVGKTTLARLLYNDTKVHDHFEPKAWVCVSDDFDIFKITDAILQDVTKENKKFKDLNQLQKALTEQLKDKRFLLVVDDVWSENYGDWENLVRPFLSCAPGSRIIMTTRKNQLLKQIGLHNVDRLESLSNEDALRLFAIHALGVDNFDSHTTLKPQGEGIVKKCGCLPLALKAIGRLLRTKTDREDWDEVLNSEIWDVEVGNTTESGKDVENSDKIVPALRISYHELSADLKQLFAYCSLFPKDFLFDKEELVSLWMAEGFLNPSKSPERLGREYFEILLSRSFFQHAPNDESLFIMHDLMNDLATFVAGEFFLRFDNHMKTKREALAKYRHMSFTREEYVGYQKFEAFKGAKSLRTFLAVSLGVDKVYYYLSSKILDDLLPELTLLRVLSLSHFKISEVPEFIGTLKHLRYLNLSQTNIEELPENVGNLYNLQTLIVSECRRLTKLPKSFLNLKRLRHFDIRGTPLEKLPLGIGELESLQTLTKIIIEGDDGFAINELKGLTNLHGKVSIEGLHIVQSAKHAREANLSLKKITGLELQWVDVFDGSRIDTLEEEVLNELKPNSDTLKTLSVVSYRGTQISNWVGDRSFHELVDVSIRGCKKCTSLPPFGLLPSLKRLQIQGMDEVKIIGLELTGNDVNAFRSLEVLRFEDMCGWEGWLTKNVGSAAVFPCLKELYVKNCPQLIHVSLQALPSLKVLEIHRCGDGVLTSLVQVASSVTKLEIDSISGLTYEVWRGVIRYLKEVEGLSIGGCNEIKYLWESETEASKLLGRLKELSFWECSGLISLEEKEEDDNFGSSTLFSLRSLHVYSCSSIKRLCCPNSIESLEIDRCSVITDVYLPKDGGNKLKSLTISRCDKLEGKINNTSMPMLETLNIYKWENLRSISELSNSTHLTSLGIYDCPHIMSLPELQLSNLTRLSISECESLESLPELLNLTSLSVSNCDSMESLPELSNLTFLSIEDCERLVSLPELKNLALLKDLKIKRCPGVDVSIHCVHWPPKLCSLELEGLKKPILEWGDLNFPTSLVDLTLYGEPHVSDFSQLSHLFPSSLTSLHILNFDNLESHSTGLQHLTSLQHLAIYRCRKVNDLPETLLPSLLSLIIDECPKLKERCSGRGSHYWPHISHIPCIYITD
ncbi:putative virus X resistance protein-like, coiled-coil [Helianthus annuus]|uniref:Virus X resistance protein-like, coiled-coil n=1 Tax=Helianthus annuus TaxID=4232 RepID=A0A9K3HD06_HELAN|nr:putative disease resistance protein RGA4 [Helianthus annuus]KAF5775810.1 putative virus X resistance protein-like, coiled-coil [Helianthus annuus]